MEGDQLPAGKTGEALLSIGFQLIQVLKKPAEIFGKGIPVLRIPGAEPGADIAGHGLGVFGGEPDVGVLLVVVPFQIVDLMFLLAAEQRDAGGGVDDPQKYSMEAVRNTSWAGRGSPFFSAASSRSW